MTLKRWIALLLSAVMALGVLTGCGGSNGVSGSLSNNEINSLLDKVGSDIDVVYDSSLNNAVRRAAAKVVSSGSTDAVQRTVSKDMGWGAVSNLGSLLSGLGILNPNISLKLGIATAVKESDLKANTGAGGWAALIGANRTMVAQLAPINTPEKFAAALVLAADGTIGQLGDVTNGAIGVTYNVSGCKATTSDGTVYWVFATQVTASV